jgi:hypothetical protein
MREEDAEAIARRLGNLTRKASSDLVRFRFGGGGGRAPEDEPPKPGKKVRPAASCALSLRQGQGGGIALVQGKATASP